MIKAVIDTNILISGQGDDYNYGSRIIDAVISGQIEAFANAATLRENRLIASRKVSDFDYAQKLERFYQMVRTVPAEGRLNVLEDPEDNKILESALAAHAQYLVTSDWHLLKLGEYQGVKIISPQGFWAVFEEDKNDGWQNWIQNFLR